MSFLSGSVRKGLALTLIGAGMMVSMTDDAEARWRRGYGGHRGAAVAAAAIGGLAAGALIAGSSRAYAAPSYGYGYGYAPAYSAPATYYYSGPSYYAPAYATPTYYAPRPRRVYRSYAAYNEPVCRISRKKVWLDSHTYTFRRVTRCH